MRRRKLRQLVSQKESSDPGEWGERRWTEGIRENRSTRRRRETLWEKRCLLQQSARLMGPQWAGWYALGPGRQAWWFFYSNISRVFCLFIFNWRKIALQCSWFLPYNNKNQPLSIHKSPPSWVSLSSPHSTPLSHHRVPGWGPCAIQQLPTSNLFYT